MSQKQPVALIRADELDAYPHDWMRAHLAAAELRRLHAINSELLVALRHLANNARCSPRLLIPKSTGGAA